MNLGKILISMLVVVILIVTSVGTFGIYQPNIIYMSQETIMSSETTIDECASLISSLPSGIAVSDADPFYALIATPLAVHYNITGHQEVIPMYLKNFDNPSKAVESAQSQIGITVDYEINGSLSLKETSLTVAQTFWQSSSDALILKNDEVGYNLGVVATPLASYLSIPVIVTDVIDQDVNDTLGYLGVDHVFICGDLDSDISNETFLTSIEQIIDECKNLIEYRLGGTVEYITMANPADITMPEVLDTTIIEFEDQTVGSNIVLPTQFINTRLKGNIVNYHNFTIPSDYKYAKLIIDVENLNSEFVDSLDDRMYAMVSSPDGYRYIYASTGGGLPTRDENGSILEDKIHFEITIYDEPGVYELMVLGHWFALKEGSYDATITLEKLDGPIVPLMKNLSSIAPYLTAYHKGIIFAKPEFAFAADDDIIFNGTTCPGVSQPGTNPNLIVPSNEHTMAIHDELNDLLAYLAGITQGDIQAIRNHYAENPIYIAITADPTMVPMYFYYNPDGRADDLSVHIMGYAVPSDFIYGDIDPKPGDPENNTYTYWPFQENIVGRVTGRDVQDCSALIARTIFYDNIINDMGDWKNNALVQTGCGLEFQNLPFFTKLSQFLYSGRGEPTKFPTGESTFINMKLQEDMETGNFDVKSTKFLQSGREGFTDEDLDAIKNAGVLNKLLFPKIFIKLLNSEDIVTGGADQLNSSLIFAFAHGFYNLYEFGDILMGARGFPFVTAFARIYPAIGSGLADKGTFDIRSIENMEYGPSVIFIESCITARTDGFNPENTLSQTYIHAGANAYIGATRVTADPGYLEPRPLPGGLGFGILGLMNATLRLKLLGEYPDLHFGAVIAEDFILDLIEDNTTGLALRNAKNMFLEKDANSTFLWSPPLTFSSGSSFIDNEYLPQLKTPQVGGERTRVLDKKYVALHEMTLYGDPAFNPYQPCNGG